MAREFSTKISLQRKPSILDELPDRESPTNRLMLEVLDSLNIASRSLARWRLCSLSRVREFALTPACKVICHARPRTTDQSLGEFCSKGLRRLEAHAGRFATRGRLSPAGSKDNLPARNCLHRG